MHQRSQKDASKKRDGIELGGGIPDPDLPLSKQLEQSFDTIKSHSQSIKVRTQVCRKNVLYRRNHIDLFQHIINLLSLTCSCLLYQDYKAKLTDVKRMVDDLQKKVRESESMLLAKDRIINDLRMQVNITKNELYIKGSFCRKGVENFFYSYFPNS